MNENIMFNEAVAGNSPARGGAVRTWLDNRVRALPGLLVFVIFSVALSRGQSLAETPTYVEAPTPKCDSFSMQNRIRLSKLEKTCYYVDQLFTPSAIFGAAFFGAIAQATGSPSDWPQGAKGFEWRASTRYVQGMAKTTGSYLAGLALREDPRPVRPECEDPNKTMEISKRPTASRGFWRRLSGAVAVNFWARNDHCKMRPVFSASAGALSSGFVGMAWTADSSNTVTKAIVRSGTALGGTIGSSIFTEFKGDIIKKITGQKSGPK